MNLQDETSWLKYLDVEELQKLRRKVWTFVYWPYEEYTHAPTDYDKSIVTKNLARTLTDNCMPSLISPCHDRDVKDDGTLAKPHHHIVLFFEQPVRYKYVLKFVQLAVGLDTVKYVEPVHNVRAMMRYLTHMDSPEKAQYDPLDVVEVCGAKHVIEDETASEMVIEAIIEHGFVTMTQTLNFFVGNPSCRKWIVNNPGVVRTLNKEQVRSGHAGNKAENDEIVKMAVLEQMVIDELKPKDDCS